MNALLTHKSFINEIYVIKTTLNLALGRATLETAKLGDRSPAFSGSAHELFILLLMMMIISFRASRTCGRHCALHSAACNTDTAFQCRHRVPGDPLRECVSLSYFLGLTAITARCIAQLTTPTPRSNADTAFHRVAMPTPRSSRPAPSMRSPSNHLPSFDRPAMSLLRAAILGLLSHDNTS